MVLLPGNVPRQPLEQSEGLSVSDTDQNRESLPDKKPEDVPQNKSTKVKSAKQPAKPAASQPAGQADKQSAEKPAQQTAEKPAQQTAESPAKPAAGESTKKSTEQPTKPPPPKQPASKGATGGTGKALGGFALVLSLCALGVGGYLGWRGQTLEQELPELRAGLDQLQPQIARQQARLAGLERSSSADTNQYQQHLQQLQYQLQQSQQREARLLSRVDILSDKVRTLEGSTRSQWRIAEVEYLLNLANQRLLTVHDVAGSRELLSTADKILEQMDDYALFPVRQALAEDLAVLQTAPQINRQNIWLQLQAITDLIPKLTVLDNQPHLTDRFQPETEATGSTDAVAGRDWRKIAEDVLMDTWQRFTSLFRVTTERTEPVEILLTSEQEQLIRQKMQLLIEQSQLALITGQQSVYQLSLQQASKWLSRYFLVNSNEGQQLSDELAKLATLTIVPNVPSIQRSLAALKALNPPEPEPASASQSDTHTTVDGQTAAKPEPASATADGQTATKPEPASASQSDTSTAAESARSGEPNS